MGQNERQTHIMRDRDGRTDIRNKTWSKIDIQNERLTARDREQHREAV